MAPAASEKTAGFRRLAARPSSGPVRPSDGPNVGSTMIQRSRSELRQHRLRPAIGSQQEQASPRRIGASRKIQGRHSTLYRSRTFNSWRYVSVISGSRLASAPDSSCWLATAQSRSGF